MKMNKLTSETKPDNIIGKKMWQKPRFWAIHTKETQMKGNKAGVGFGPGGNDFRIKVEDS
jgi:hypothetical protein